MSTLFLRTADGAALVPVADVVRHVMTRDSLPAKPAAVRVHDTLKPLAELLFYAATDNDFPRPLAREHLFTWTQHRSGLVGAGFDRWCRVGEGPMGLDYVGWDGTYCMLLSDARALFGFGAAAPDEAPKVPPAEERPAESKEARQRRRLDRLHELGGTREWRAGKWAAGGEHGALALLAREERDAGRPYGDDSDVRKDLNAEADRRRLRKALGPS